MEPQKEKKYYGLRACLTLFEVRPKDIIRICLLEKRLGDLKFLLHYCAKNKRAYHIVSEADLQKISGSIHHEGVCILARTPTPLTWDEFYRDFDTYALGAATLVAVDGVENPHNLGFIARTCVNFGVRFLLIMGKMPSESDNDGDSQAGDEQIFTFSGSAGRSAEGSGEFVTPIYVKNLKKCFEDLKKLGFITYATSSHKGENLYAEKFGPRNVMFLGGETYGLSQNVLKFSDKQIMIPGSGLVESLNVSVATGVILGEIWRQTKS